MYSYVFNAAGKKGLRRLDKQFQRQVLDDIEEICKLRHPKDSQNVKKLEGGHDADTYRLRSGDYRVVFRIDTSLLRIVSVFNKQAGKRGYK
ncbi:MAG: hypothetical protein UY70_C0016G0002 [Candidatus Kaiserbacteria bacterium GW2011_GWB1_52_6]|uniref:Plasmid stabilization system n=1 Tax=Candidatus Kaiserbacteria bacterium GW2011_GWB1_52_6 TaxID=1618674 RepID=A0A0G1X7Z5_9BACT|nr:MAG: hypothetical protein UY70_C0016G0002 [Candidatus Kaiserbacteria bacterium GW2011_GWB1_52_6]